jgi:hypothetical protein
MNWREQLESDGFAFLRGVLSPEAVAGVLDDWAEVTRAHAGGEALLTGEGGPAYGARNLLELWPRVAELARAPAVREALREVLGEAAGVVRVLYFDKPPGHSWALPWHKDYSLAVEAHGPACRSGGGNLPQVPPLPPPVFTKPTVKAGVPHVVAPQEVLDRMLTLRVHLDDVAPENGPLRVVPGSHRAYHQKDDPPRQPVTLHCRAGDVLLMRPLVTHASGHSTPGAGLHRRILHLECAADPTLSDGYRWKWFVGVRPG